MNHLNYLKEFYREIHGFIQTEVWSQYFAKVFKPSVAKMCIINFTRPWYRIIIFMFPLKIRAKILVNLLATARSWYNQIEVQKRSWFSRLLSSKWGTRWRSWLMHYATSRKITGSIPDEVIGIFNWPNPFNRPTALGWTQPLTEMSTRNLPGSNWRSALKAEILNAICEPIVEKMWDPRRLRTLWASTACYRDSFTFTF
jgi:hypothetical protein